MITLDLKSATNRASWHPLTSLIEWEGAWQERYFYGIPFIASGQWSDFSSIHHELTHLWCARTTRLGWFLGQTAAKSLMTWRNSRESFLIEPCVETILGVFTPLLEGLAMYAELDYEAHDHQSLLSNPLTIHADMIEPERGLSLIRTLRGVREFAASELLRLLFLNSEQSTYSFYLGGYLYVKATIAFMAQHCPRLALPDTALPLLIRLWCDHPAIEEAMKGKPDAAGLIEQLHQTILSLSPETLNALADMIDNNSEVVTRFDHWQIHAQLSAGQFSEPIFTDTSMSYFDLETELGELFSIERAGFSIHFLSRITGLLVTVGENDKNKAVIRNSDGETEVELLPIGKVWDFLFRMVDKRQKEMILKYQEIANALQYKFGQAMQEAVGKEVTIANFMTFSGSYGIVIWTDEKCEFLPYSWDTFDYSNNIEFMLISEGIKISPNEKLQFSKSLRKSSFYKEALGISTEKLYQTLIGDSRRREQIKNQGFTFARQAHYDNLEKWCQPNPGRTANWELDSATATWLTEIFDLPGFRPISEAVSFSFSDLLPKIPPIL